MSYDEEPDGDPHGECAATIARLTAELAELRTTITPCEHARLVAEASDPALREEVKRLRAFVAAWDARRSINGRNDATGRKRAALDVTVLAARAAVGKVGKS